jgi:hypothetical protein
VRLESGLRRKQMLAVRRWVILAAALLAAFATVLPWGWTGDVNDGDGQVILLLAAVGIFAVLRYSDHRVGLMLASEAVLGVIVALTAFVHLAWGERGPGLALLLLAGPLWFAGASLPGPYIRWVAAAFASDDWPGRDSSKPCPECQERIRLSVPVCRFCGFWFDADVEWIERPPLSRSGRSMSLPSARSFGNRENTLGRTSERWRKSA